MHNPGVQFESQETHAPLTKAKPVEQLVHVTTKLKTVQVTQFEVAPEVVPPYIAELEVQLAQILY